MQDELSDVFDFMDNDNFCTNLAGDRRNFQTRGAPPADANAKVVLEIDQCLTSSIDEVAGAEGGSAAAAVLSEFCRYQVETSDTAATMYSTADEEAYYEMCILSHAKDFFRHCSIARKWIFVLCS